MLQVALQPEAVNFFNQRAPGEVSFWRRKPGAGESHFFRVHAECGFPADIAHLQRALPECERAHTQVAGEDVMSEITERAVAANQHNSLRPRVKPQGAQ